MKITSYKELIVWQKGIELVELVYILTKQFPKDEQFGLISQLRRAVISIPSNIAEGFGRQSEKDYKHFYKIAYGSALEVETQLLIAKRLNYGEEVDYIGIEKIFTEICKMLNRMSSN